MSGDKIYEFETKINTENVWDCYIGLCTELSDLNTDCSTNENAFMYCLDGEFWSSGSRKSYGRYLWNYKSHMIKFKFN